VPEPESLLAPLPSWRFPLPRRAMAWVFGLGYAAVWGIAGRLWTGPLNDLDIFSLPAARIALGGHPLEVYALRFQSIIANDNGPLGLVPLTMVAALASRLGWLDDVRMRRMFILAVFSIFIVLMSREAVAAIDRMRGARLEGWGRLLAYGVFVASPSLWNSVLGYGHVEQPLTIWLVLLGVRKLAGERPATAGFSFGLALLTRTLATLPIIPLALLLLVRRRWRSVVLMTGTAAVTVALGLLPFVLADPGDTLYSLVTHRSNLAVSGGSIWRIAVGTPYEWIPQRLDIVFVLGLAVLACLIVIRARPDLQPSSGDIYGLLALSALTLPLLAKNVWPYYFLDAYVFGAIWWLGQENPLALGRRLIGPALPVIAVIGTSLTEVEMGPTDALLRLREGVTMGVLLIIVIVALTVRLRQRRMSSRAA
jgi:Glycosyltransferase family 87